MVSERVLIVDRRGYTFLEVLVVIGIVGVLAAVSLPSLITYMRAGTLKAGAEELAAGLNGARQIAIARNQRVCVEVTGNRYRYLINGCGGEAWTGPGSGANGFFRLANNIGVTSNVNPVFDYLGAANPGATLTVSHPQGGTTLTVVVSVAGRVRICPAAGCAQ